MSFQNAIVILKSQVGTYESKKFKNPGLVIMGDDSCLRCRGFESQHCKLDQHDVFHSAFPLPFMQPSLNGKEVLSITHQDALIVQWKRKKTFLILVGFS